MQYLKEAGWADGGRVIACTQPRRLAVQVTNKPCLNLDALILLHYPMFFPEYFACSVGSACHIWNYVSPVG